MEENYLSINPKGEIGGTTKFHDKESLEIHLGMREHSSILISYIVKTLTPKEGAPFYHVAMEG
jgi:hypothetical protein